MLFESCLNRTGSSAIRCRYKPIPSSRLGFSTIALSRLPGWGFGLGLEACGGLRGLGAFCFVYSEKGSHARAAAPADLAGLLGLLNAFGPRDRRLGLWSGLAGDAERRSARNVPQSQPRPAAGHHAIAGCVGWAGWPG